MKLIKTRAGGGESTKESKWESGERERENEDTDKKKKRRRKS
jgi:hypothetical protein